MRVEVSEEGAGEGGLDCCLYFGDSPVVRHILALFFAQLASLSSIFCFQYSTSKNSEKMDVVEEYALIIPSPPLPINPTKPSNDNLNPDISFIPPSSLAPGPLRLRRPGHGSYN